MSAEILTKEEFEEFEKRLFSKIDSLNGKINQEQPKWLKSYQVKNLLKISQNTLQKLRMDGTLKSTKIGGILYYNYEDILKVLEGDAETK